MFVVGVGSVLTVNNLVTFAKDIKREEICRVQARYTKILGKEC